MFRCNLQTSFPCLCIEENHFLDTFSLDCKSTQRNRFKAIVIYYSTIILTVMLTDDE